MTTFSSPELGISTDELFSPGYVSFDCAKWGLPDNTMGKVGWFVVYRPLWEDDLDKLTPEHRDIALQVTPEMRDATRKHYIAQRTAEQSAAAAREAKEQTEYEAYMAQVSDPAWRTKEAERARKEREYDLVQNEGAEGYNPYREGDVPTYSQRRD